MTDIVAQPRPMLQSTGTARGGGEGTVAGGGAAAVRGGASAIAKREEQRDACGAAGGGSGGSSSSSSSGSPSIIPRKSGRRASTSSAASIDSTGKSDGSCSGSGATPVTPNAPLGALTGPTPPQSPRSAGYTHRITHPPRPEEGGKSAGTAPRPMAAGAPGPAGPAGGAARPASSSLSSTQGASEQLVADEDNEDDGDDCRNDLIPRHPREGNVGAAGPSSPAPGVGCETTTTPATTTTTAATAVPCKGKRESAEAAAGATPEAPPSAAAAGGGGSRPPPPPPAVSEEGGAAKSAPREQQQQQQQQQPPDMKDVIAQVERPDVKARARTAAAAAAAALRESYTLQVGKYVVDPEKYQRWRALGTNYSPFDAKLFYPLLQPPPELEAESVAGSSGTTSGRKSAPPKRSKVLLCLDIDETLVHASTAAKAKTLNPDHEFVIGDQVKGGVRVFVGCRPHLREFLNFVSSRFELAIFTASQPMYADPLLACIDPDGFLSRSRLYRQHCAEIDGARVKDLSLLGRPLDRVCLLDNSPVAYLFQPRNAIPIVSWFDDSNDTELLKLLPMLQDLVEAESVYDVLDPWNCSAGAFNGDSHLKVMNFVENNSRNGKIGAKR